MKGKIYVFLLVCILCSTFYGCNKETALSTAEDGRSVSMQMSIGTRASGASSEDKIESLHVYAFVRGELAGYYHDTGDPITLAPFLMDLTVYSTSKQEVTFYVIANETAVTGTGLTLSEKTTISQLENLSFTEYNDEVDVLPMACKKIVELDVAVDSATEAEETGATNADEHAGHTVLNETVKLELERCVAKLDLYVAKANGETGVLKILDAKMLQAGTQYKNYVMPQEMATLKKINSRPSDLAIAVNKNVEIRTFPYAKTDEEYEKAREDKGNYTYVLLEPFYPFENPYGTEDGNKWAEPSSDGYNDEGEYRGHILEISYQFDSNEPRSGKVYLPRVERNTYYAIYCLINNSGSIVIKYEVMEWNDESWTFEFTRPTYDNPVLPYINEETESTEADIKKLYPDGPTLYYTGVDPDDAEKVLADPGVFKVSFRMTAPTGLPIWTPILPSTSLSDYQVRVYDSEGQPAVQPVEAGPKPYTICVIPLNPLQDSGTDTFVELGVSYIPEWTGELEYLHINGTADELAWGPDSGSSTIMKIRHIEKP